MQQQSSYFESIGHVDGHLQFFLRSCELDPLTHMQRGVWFFFNVLHRDLMRFFFLGGLACLRASRILRQWQTFFLRDLRQIDLDLHDFIDSLLLVLWFKS